MTSRATSGTWKRCTPRLPRPNPRALSVSTHAQAEFERSSPASRATASSAQSSPLEAADDDDAADPHADPSLAARLAGAADDDEPLVMPPLEDCSDVSDEEEDGGELTKPRRPKKTKADWQQDSPCIAIDIVTNGNSKAKRIIALSAAYLGPMDAQTDPTVTAVTDAPIFSEYVRVRATADAKHVRSVHGLSYEQLQVPPRTNPRAPSPPSRHQLTSPRASPSRRPRRRKTLPAWASNSSIGLASRETLLGQQRRRLSS